MPFNGRMFVRFASDTYIPTIPLSSFATTDRQYTMDNPVLRQVLLGCYDPSSPLRHLRGQRGILELIFARLMKAWEAHIDDNARGVMRLGGRRGASMQNIPGRVPQRLRFPEPWPQPMDPLSNRPCDFHVNMMPFVMGDITSLPTSCQRYHDIIVVCLAKNSSGEHGKVGYLTIHEGMVEAGTSQRRGGLHIEAGGGGGQSIKTEDFFWGQGRFEQNVLHGGIYMASTVDQSCAIYDVVIQDPASVVGELGNVEHLRSSLAKKDIPPLLLLATELVWMTDRTPHESLPLPVTTFRQYFRLVTSGVSHWYADHSTPNPLSIQPTAKIVFGNKFHAAVHDVLKAPQNDLST
ncbi:hypothetical protein DYB26_009973 [Aphanomyces astaci]|uniref:Uncharacterized protein n=2 Tax=Aphanomyces astaci TaxID=112090 RepID=A0A397FUR1_APHAT|nr:hypothetical protein DYB38_007856 [Aphanomyces astaci]RHY83812.1 hypothetical protein DYB26_009973 [Aphanomyces astaci]RHZ40512.1 hypothetical protein DYB31_008733 [Aphanomyces astaci]